MIELNKHIEILLLSNDCVIIPNFGGFMAHYVDASFDEKTSTFLPPMRSLGFNPQVKVNDHLLVQSYIEAYDISYPEALRRIESEVEEVRQHLQSEGEYELSDLGTLKVNEEGNYEFCPCEAGVLTPSMYGLGTFEMKTLAVLAAENVKHEKEQKIAIESDVTSNSVEELKETITDDGQEAVVIKMRWIRNVAAVAAAIVAFFFMGTPVANDQPQPQIQQSSIFSISQETVVPEPETLDCITEAPVANETPSTPVEEPKAEPVAKVEEKAVVEKTIAEKPVQVQKAAKKRYAIVLASQTMRKNAENFLTVLKEQGVDAQIIDMEGTTKVRVVYGAFETNEEAHEQLQKMRAENSSVFKEAWVLKAFK